MFTSIRIESLPRCILGDPSLVCLTRKTYGIGTGFKRRITRDWLRFSCYPTSLCTGKTSIALMMLTFSPHPSSSIEAFQEEIHLRGYLAPIAYDISVSSEEGF